MLSPILFHFQRQDDFSEEYSINNEPTIQKIAVLFLCSDNKVLLTIPSLIFIWKPPIALRQKIGTLYKLLIVFYMIEFFQYSEVHLIYMHKYLHHKRRFVFGRHLKFMFHLICIAKCGGNCRNRWGVQVNNVSVLMSKNSFELSLRVL